MLVARSWPALPLALLLVAGPLAAGALGQEAEDSAESPLVTEYFAAPAADFRTDGKFANHYLLFHAEPGYVEGSGCAHAPVVLPQGATATALIGYLWDNDAAASASLYLRRQATTSAGPADEMAAVTTTLNTAQVIAYPDFSVVYATIDNDTYTYFLVYCDPPLTANQRLYAARVGYTR